MPVKIDTYKYHFKVGRKVIHYGILPMGQDLKLREQELRQYPYPGWDKGRAIQVGNNTTFDNARIWELKKTFMGNPTDYLQENHPRMWKNRVIANASA